MRKSRVKELMPKSSFTLKIPRSHQGAPAKELVPKSASKSSSTSSCQKALVQRAPTKKLIEEERIRMQDRWIDTLREKAYVKIY